MRRREGRRRRHHVLVARGAARALAALSLCDIPKTESCLLCFPSPTFRHLTPCCSSSLPRAVCNRRRAAKVARPQCQASICGSNVTSHYRQRYQCIHGSTATADQLVLPHLLNSHHPLPPAPTPAPPAASAFLYYDQAAHMLACSP